MNILHYTINRQVTTQKLRKATLSLTCLTGAVLRENFKDRERRSL